MLKATSLSTAGQATAQQSLLATATDGAGHYSTATTFMTPPTQRILEEAMVTLAEITAIQETMAQLAGIMGMVQTQVQTKWRFWFRQQQVLA